MDTTPEYVKMCEKAKEIQNNRPDSEELWENELSFAWVKEDVLWCSKCNGEASFGTYCVSCGTRLMNKEGNGYLCSLGDAEGYGYNVWLPRQDQLQDMVDHDAYQYGLIVRLHDWVQEGNINSRDITACSLEQLWLAFVMKENYGKVWTGEEWAKG